MVAMIATYLTGFWSCLLHFSAHGLSVYAYNCIAYLREGTLFHTLRLYVFALSGFSPLHRVRLNRVLILSGLHEICRDKQWIFLVYNFRRAPMFVFEFEKALFEFAYARPHCAPLFALPPTFSSSTIYRLFGVVSDPLPLCWSHKAVEGKLELIQLFASRGAIDFLFCAFRKYDLLPFRLQFLFRDSPCRAISLGDSFYCYYFVLRLL